MQTILRRIDLAAATIEEDINNHSTILRAGGFRLVTSFVYGEQLVLVFQTP